MRGRVSIAVLLAALIPSAIIAWRGRDMPHLGVRHDDTIYWVCAKSLAAGTGYRIVSLPGEPYQTKYPPLYPLALSALWRLNSRFPDNLPLLTALCWLFLPCYLWLARKLVPHLGLDARHGLVVCVLLALSPYAILYSISAMSEVPFSCVLLGCLLVAGYAGEPGRKWWVALVAGALGGAAYLTRSAAFPLLISAPLLLLWRGRRAQAALFLAGMLPAVVGWNLWVRAHIAASTDPLRLFYTDYIGYYFANFSLRDLPMVALKNLEAMLPGIGGSLMLGGSDSTFGKALFAVAGVASVVGVIRLAVRRGVSQYHLYGAFYAVMLLPWEMSSHERVQRLLFPLLPLLVVGVTYEFRVAAGWLAARYRADGGAARVYAAPALVGLGAAAVLYLATTITMMRAFPGFIDGNRSDLSLACQGYQWISENVPSASALLSDKDPLLYLYTGRHSIGLALPPRLAYVGDRPGIERFVDSAGDYARTHGLDYVVLSRRGERRYISSEVAAAPEGMRLVHESPRMSIYAVK
jgi:hypothetical protein